MPNKGWALPACFQTIGLRVKWILKLLMSFVLYAYACQSHSTPTHCTSCVEES